MRSLLLFVLLSRLLVESGGALPPSDSIQNDFDMATRTLLTWDLSPVLALKEQALQGAWLDMLINTFDQYCALIGQLPVLPQPNVERLNLQFKTACRTYSVPLMAPQQLFDLREFSTSKDLIIMATGWRNTVDNSEALRLLAAAFKCRGDVNFVAVDAAKYVDTLYTWSSFNTQRIGEYLGDALVLLVDGGVPQGRIHLIGHSLGAQIVGEAARRYNALTGRKLPRITALDPARPCFRADPTDSSASAATELRTVRKADAQLVVVVHSNSGILGQRQPLGDVDFYASGVGAIQPGCYTIECSHSRAVAYFVESVYPGREGNFPAYRCANWTQLAAKRCAVRSANRMGYGAYRSPPGLYYVPVHAQAPYGSAATTKPQRCATVIPCAASATPGGIGDVDDVGDWWGGVFQWPKRT